jgi:hypothetical protein
VHRAVAPRISQVGAEAAASPLRARGVEGLLVLAERGRAHEALVGQLEPLAPGGRGQASLRVTDLRTIELEIARIGDQRIGGLAVEAVVVAGGEGERSFRFDQRRPRARLGFNAGPDPQGHRVRGQRQSVLLDVLVAEPGIHQRDDFNLLGVRGSAANDGGRHE